jgi:hypothetical protein
MESTVGTRHERVEKVLHFFSIRVDLKAYYPGILPFYLREKGSGDEG